MIPKLKHKNIVMIWKTQVDTFTAIEEFRMEFTYKNVVQKGCEIEMSCGILYKKYIQYYLN